MHTHTHPDINPNPSPSVQLTLQGWGWQIFLSACFLLLLPTHIYICSVSSKEPHHLLLLPPLLPSLLLSFSLSLLNEREIKAFRSFNRPFHSPSVANSSFRRRDHLRLIAFHPLLVRSFGGLARGVSLFFLSPPPPPPFFELFKRPCQEVACGHPQMSSRLGRP
ncbi:hypothetical protein B0F90DRAFT_633464 [Multifurca ochricompacta]|uniref:Uncharacterized protein n=1 Tax=Multifurca ochricompacta TaxID=376703 RepID=A0AAD4M3K6_9AGAM|nr:hypothetical protein B0F90DRAFT_633464 [Multifurca ochricompacta]